MTDIAYRCGLEGMSFTMNETSFFMSRDTLVLGKRPGICACVARYSGCCSATRWRSADLFEIPPNRVIELGHRWK